MPTPHKKKVTPLKKKKKKERYPNFFEAKGKDPRTPSYAAEGEEKYLLGRNKVMPMDGPERRRRKE